MDDITGMYDTPRTTMERGEAEDPAGKDQEGLGDGNPTFGDQDIDEDELQEQERLKQDAMTTEAKHQARLDRKQA